MTAPSTPPPPASRPPQRRRPTTTVIIEDEESSNIWKVLCFLLLVGLGTAWAFFHFKKDTPPPATTATVATTLDNILDPTGRPPKDDTPVVVEDTPPPPPDITTPEHKQASLPALPSFERADALAALAQVTEARIQDERWEEHFSQLAEAALTTINRRSRLAGARQLDSLAAPGALPLALAQMELREKLGEDAFATWARESQPFSTRLLASPVRMELLLNNLAPEDKLTRVLAIWENLDAKADTPADKARYENLALALALVHDRDNRSENATAAYDYYVQTDKQGRLYVTFGDIQPDELVFGVGDPFFGLSGMEWALKNLKHAASRLGAAYPQVPYRINHPPYPEYTMENVLKMGGVCEQQAKFSQTNARARGVPSADVGGMGSRGGHAWFAHKTSQGWDNGTGRYNDGYACGHTRNPQTGKSMREWDLFLFDDAGRKNGDREAAFHLRRAARLLAAAGDTSGQLDLLESAAYRNSGNPAPWGEFFLALLEDKKDRPVDYWQKLVRDYRMALKNHPDFFDISDRVEIEKIFPRQDPDRVGEFLRNRRRQALRENPERFDLLMDSIQREIAYYQSRGDTRRIGLLYNNSLRDVGTHLPSFLTLAGNFAKDAETNPEIRRAALTVMENVFNREIDSKLKGDTFRLSMEADVCRKLAAILNTDGSEQKASRYAKRAETISAAAKAKRAAMQ